MKKTALIVLICFALVEKSLTNPSGFPRRGKSMLYQYFHRPGQNLFVRGYNSNDEDRTNGGNNQNRLEVMTFQKKLE